MLKRSEFKRGEFLVTSNGSIFIHDGYKNGDGYGFLSMAAELIICGLLLIKFDDETEDKL